MKETALITGASSGIGLALAKRFAAQGINLVLVARNETRLNELQREISTNHKVTVHVCAVDLSAPDGAQTVFSYCENSKLDITHLVNNAGFGDYGHFAAREWNKYQQMIQLNVLSLTHLTHLFLQRMLTTGFGRILNVASIAGLQPDPRFAVYGASKAYVISFSEALHKELEGTGVTCTVLSPGVTKTNFLERADMAGARIAKSGLMEAAEVAAVGYAGMMKGDLHVIPGLKNKVLGFFSSIMPPGRLRLAISAKIMEPDRPS